MVDLVQSLDRRGFLAAVAAAVASTSRFTNAQTLIADAPAAGPGIARVPEQRPTSPAPARLPAQATPQTDWRKQLLAGERSILLRRDGAARRIRYCTSDGLLDREGYAQLCYVLRDVRANRMCLMDPALLDLMCGMQRWGEYNGHGSTFVVLSGFRTTTTNSLTEGAAKNSLHQVGKATDGQMEGFSSGLTAAMALRFNNQGGNGIYPSAHFVHMDTGRARTWVHGG